MYYILNDKGHPVRVDDVLKWASLFKETDRQIALDTVGDTTTVSTIFMGMDYLNSVVPLLFETMIFGGEYDGYQRRSATKENALIEHEKALNLIKDNE